VIGTDKFSYNFFTLCSTGFPIFYKVNLADVVSCQCSYGSLALSFCQAILKYSQTFADFESALDGEIAIEVGFEHLIDWRLQRIVFDKGKSLFVGVVGMNFLEMIVGLEH
jgi:hypothetical protein